MSARLICLIVLRLYALALCFLYFPLTFFQILFMAPPLGPGGYAHIPTLLMSLIPLAVGIVLWKVAPRLAALIIPEDDVVNPGAITETGLARLVLQMIGVYFLVRNIGLIVTALATRPVELSDTSARIMEGWAISWLWRCGVELAVASVLIFYAGAIASWLARRGNGRADPDVVES